MYHLMVGMYVYMVSNGRDVCVHVYLMVGMCVYMVSNSRDVCILAYIMVGIYVYLKGELIYLPIGVLDSAEN